MVELKTDRELLREYVEQGSETAFGSLVERHLNLVFATALRGLNDSGSAQEIAQNVFIALARKGVWLCGETNLAAWLHKATLLEVRHWWRGESRRQRREQSAVSLGTTMKDEDSLHRVLAGELDEGLLSLRETDRQALMLRYFEGRSHREIGTLLCASEDAVRMRIEKALDRLTHFFRRRGYSVSAVAITVTVLNSAVKAAPAGFAITTMQAALVGGGGSAATGLKLLAAKIMGFTKLQTAIFCLSLMVVPILWELNTNRISINRAKASHEQLAALLGKQSESDAELVQLRAESTRLDGALAKALQTRDGYDAAAVKLATLKSKAQHMLTDANYQWPDDSPYVRVSKSIVASLNLLDRVPGTFTSLGTLTDSAQEFFGITSGEKVQIEPVLGNYWHKVQEMMTANAYLTNTPGERSGRLAETVIVPALGKPLKTLAEDTGAQLTEVLGADREKLLFGGWDQGGIQIFWPGNLWNISDKGQVFKVWIDPATNDSPLKYGAGWHEQFGGGTSGDCPGSLASMPKSIYERFFAGWLEQAGVSSPTQFFGN